jgi:hypothetical protein
MANRASAPSAAAASSDASRVRSVSISLKAG